MPQQVDQLVSLCQVAAEGIARARVAPPKRVNNRAQEAGLVRQAQGSVQQVISGGESSDLRSFKLFKTLRGGEKK